MKLKVKKIIEIMEDKIYLFEEETGIKPKYIKIPTWVFVLLNEHFNSIMANNVQNKNNDDDAYYFCGVIICETDTISLLSQIEVF